MTDCFCEDREGLLIPCARHRLKPSRLPLPNPTAAGPPTDPGLDMPWRKLTPTDCLPWWAAHSEATCSEKTAKALVWLEDCFGGI